NLELVLALQQGNGGGIYGKADVTWKIVMGQSEGGYQNVAYRKIGTFDVSGTYRKTNSQPVEFAFVEKDGRRINFVGRVEGDILGGKSVPPEEKGATWTGGLKKKFFIIPEKWFFKSTENNPRQEIPFNKPIIKTGRKPGNDLSFPRPEISGNH